MKGVAISPVNIESRKEIGIKAGDTVRVWQKVEEKGKIRLQSFEGLVLARKHGDEPGATFTVRRVSGGVGVEKIFPLYSPNIDKIEIVRRAKVRRAKLYHIRDKAARQIRRQMRNMRFVDISSESEMEMAAAKEREAQEAEEAANPSTTAQDDSTKVESEETKVEETPAAEETNPSAPSTDSGQVEAQDDSSSEESEEKTEE